MGTEIVEILCTPAGVDGFLNFFSTHFVGVLKSAFFNSIIANGVSSLQQHYFRHQISSMLLQKASESNCCSIPWSSCYSWSCSFRTSRSHWGNAGEVFVPPSCTLYFWLSLFCASEKKRLLPARAQSMISFPRQRLIRTGSFFGCVFWEYSTMKSLDMRVIFISNFLSSCYCHNRFTGSGARTQGIARVWWWC